jgi:hypothetical protein
MVREYNVVVRVRVATYSSDLEVKIFAESISEVVQRTCYVHPHFVCETNPSVEVNYDTRT